MKDAHHETARENSDIAYNSLMFQNEMHKSIIWLIHSPFEVLKSFMYKIAFMLLLKYEEPLGNSDDNRDKQAM